MKLIIMAKRCYALCAECHYAECRYAEFSGASTQHEAYTKLILSTKFMIVSISVVLDKGVEERLATPAVAGISRTAFRLCKYTFRTVHAENRVPRLSAR